jgi:hypothetical protein
MVVMWGLTPTTAIEILGAVTSPSNVSDTVNDFKPGLIADPTFCSITSMRSVVTLIRGR